METPKRNLFADVQSYVIALVIAGLIWLYAEANTAGKGEVEYRIQFVAQPDQFIEQNDDLKVTMTFVCATGQVGDVEALRVEPIQLEVTDELGSDTQRTISLKDALARYEPLAAMGVTVKEVRPESVQIDVHRLITKKLKIDIDALEANHRFKNKPKLSDVTAAEVTLPEQVFEAYGAGLTLKVVFDNESLATTQVNQDITEPWPITLDQYVMGDLPSNFTAEIDPQNATVSFTLKDDNVPYEIERVTVLVMLPPDEIGKYVTELGPDDKFRRDIKVDGPSEIIDELKQNVQDLRLFVELSSDDMAKGEVTRTPEFKYLPPQVNVNTPPRSVTVTIKPLSQIANSPPVIDGGDESELLE